MQDDRHMTPRSAGTRPRPRHYSDAIIYELHVRGFTEGESSGIATEKRGTFKSWTVEETVLSVSGLLLTLLLNAIIH